MAKMDQAFYAAEAGVQRLAWYVKNNQLASVTSPLTGSVGGYAYSTSWTTSGTVTTITSRGSLGNVSYTCYMTATPGTDFPPTFSSGGNFDNKNVTITGDVSTAGSYSNSGSGSLSGNLTYVTTATGTGSVGGTVSRGAFYSIDVNALVTTLQAQAGTSYAGAQTAKNFDFTTVPGTNKVIYVNGNVTNPTFTGKGTLVVSGTVSVDNFGTSSNPVNIVASGDVTTGGNVTLYGTIYTAGSWYRSKVALTGLVYVSGISPSSSGASTMVQTAAPWFDPRADSNGHMPAKFLNFSGPQP
jgi:hypothetical protein